MNSCSPKSNKIKGFLNCSMYFLKVLSSSGACSSLKPMIFERLSASCHVSPFLRLLCNRRSTSAAEYVADSAVDSSISLAKFKPSAYDESYIGKFNQTSEGKGRKINPLTCSMFSTQSFVIQQQITAERESIFHRRRLIYPTHSLTFALKIHEMSSLLLQVARSSCSYRSIVQKKTSKTTRSGSLNGDSGKWFLCQKIQIG